MEQTQTRQGLRLGSNVSNHSLDVMRMLKIKLGLENSIFGNFAEMVSTTAEAIASYIEAAFDDGDTALMSHALGVVAGARGISQIAGDSGMTRDAVYKALSRDGNPTLSTLSKVMGAMGLQLTAKAMEHESVE